MYCVPITLSHVSAVESSITLIFELKLAKLYPLLVPPFNMISFNSCNGGVDVSGSYPVVVNGVALVKAYPVTLIASLIVKSSDVNKLYPWIEGVTLY